MWFKRKRKPVRVKLGDKITIETGGSKHVLALTELSCGSDGCSAVFTDNWQRYRG